MATKGHMFRFSSDPADGVSEGEDIVDASALDVLSFEEDGTVEVRTRPDHTDLEGLEDLVHKHIFLAEPRGKVILTWLKNVYHQSRGFELGTFHASPLAVTMKQQSLKWHSSTLGYVGDIIAIAHTFIIDLLRLITPNERVRMGIESLLMDQLTGKYKVTTAHVKFLLDVELEGAPATVNHYFNDKLEKWYAMAQHNNILRS